MLAADLVVVGIGVRPRWHSRSRPGSRRSRHRGRCVSADKRSRHLCGRRHRPLAGPATGQQSASSIGLLAERQGQVAARNMLGRVGSGSSQVPFFWSQHYDITIAYVGHAEQWDRLEVDGDPTTHDCAVSFWHGGRKLAVATVGRDRVSLAAEVSFEQEMGA